MAAETEVFALLVAEAGHGHPTQHAVLAEAAAARAAQPPRPSVAHAHGGGAHPVDVEAVEDTVGPGRGASPVLLLLRGEEALEPLEEAYKTELGSSICAAGARLSALLATGTPSMG